MDDILWNGCWEARKNRTICRWMAAWTINKEITQGCLAGYSGGGTFQLEKFNVKFNKIFTSNQPEYADILSESELELQEACQDLILDFHIKKSWLEWDSLVLKERMKHKLRIQEDLLFGGASIPPKIILAFDSIGLISKPNISP